jgi:succinate-semialdehyde dehydrogenase/glutarate-semialdehyde dehydrogenase
MLNPIFTQLKNDQLIRQQAYINGQWLDSQTVFEVHNPATQEALVQVSNASLEQAQVAIDSAHAALQAWSGLLAQERAKKLRLWFDLIIANADDLAFIMTLEQGKPIAEAKGEVIYGASFIEWFAEEAKRVSGDVLASTWKDKRTLVLKQPIGVCAAITPWNFPNAMITRKIAPALAAGCTIVIKPAEQTPLSALALAYLAEQAGIPKGVINVLSADSENSIKIGRLLCESKTVRHLSFTGSTPVGRILMAQCAPSIKKLALELGGHAPFIVFEDADLDAAVQGAIQSKFRNAGQTCVCTNRFYVHRSLAKEFTEKFSFAVSKLNLGNGLDANVQQGPLIDEDALLKVQSHVEDALAKGAQLQTGGQRGQIEGNFFQATVLSKVSVDMLIMQEETFGPVAAICEFETEAEVIALANSSDFGLAAYFYSRDIGRVWRVAEALEFGMVGINTGIMSNEVSPFGGIKQSGLGREGSVYGIDEYLEMKYLCMGGIDQG